MSIVSLSQVKGQLNIDPADSSDDDELQMYADAVTAAIENQLHEVIDIRPFSEDLELTGLWKFWLRNTPVVSLTSLASIDGSVTYDPANFKVRSSGLVYSVGGPNPSGMVTATYQAGYQAIPDNMLLAALQAIEDAWQDSQRGVAGVANASRANMEQVRQRLTYVLSYKVSAWLGQPTTMMR